MGRRGDGETKRRRDFRELRDFSDEETITKAFPSPEGQGVGFLVKKFFHH
jgi:hypothetical protein